VFRCFITINWFASFAWMNSIIASFRVMGYMLWCLTPLSTIFQLL
jgi:hypothetical protein